LKKNKREAYLSLAKTGPGTLTLSGANTYSGATAVVGGTLALNDVGDLAGPVTNNAAVYLYSGTGTGSSGNGGYFLTGSLSGSGSWLVDGDATGGDMWHSRVILNNANNATYSFTGAVKLTNSARLWLQSGGGMDMTCGNGATFNLTSAASTLDLYATTSGRTIRIGGLTGLGTVDIPDMWSGNGITLAVGDQDVSSAFGGAIRNSGSASRALSLAKLGSGTLTLSGTNDFSGGTTVSGGTLIAETSLGSGDVTVLSGATLGGSGAIAGSVHVYSGGTLVPGGSTMGVLTISNALTLEAASTVSVRLNATNGQRDRVQGLAAVSYSGNLVVSNLAGSGTLAAGQSYQLFSAVPSASGTFGSITPAPGPNLVWIFTPTNGTLSVVATYPTNISSSLSGGVISLTWPGTHLGWILQSNAVSLASPVNWFDIPGTSGVTNLNIFPNPNQMNIFYRLRSP